jgi:Tfp pilus assembly protein PilN/Tfp pilus assembly PilM family ATPase
MQKGKAAGISITKNFIRFVEIRKEEDKIYLDKLLEIPLIEGEQGNTLLAKDKNLIKTVKLKIQNTKFLNRAFISVPDSDVVVRTKVVPPVNQGEIFKLIEAEIKDYAIFGHSNVSLGFTVTDKNKDKLNIIWGGIKERTLFDTLKFLRKAKIRVLGVVPADFAIVEYIYSLYEEESPIATIVVDESTTKIIFSQGKKMLSVYVQDIGSSSILKKGSTGKDNWIGSVLSTLTYATENLNISVKKIFLLGQAGGISKMLKILSAHVTYPVVVPDVLEKINCERDEYRLVLQKKEGINFISPLGLALLSLDRKDNPLFCDISKHILRERQSMWIKVTVTLFIFLIVNGAYLYVNRSLIRIQKNRKDIETKIEQISQLSGNTEKLKEELNVLNDIHSNYTIAINAAKKRVITSLLLTEIKSKVSDGLYITSISVNDKGDMTINGIASSYRSVLNFEENLASAQYMTDATILSMSKKNKGNVFFQMNAKAKEEMNEGN